MSNTASPNNASPANCINSQKIAKAVNCTHSQKSAIPANCASAQKIAKTANCSGDKECGSPKIKNTQETERTLKTEYRHIPVMRDEVVSALTGNFAVNAGDAGKGPVTSTPDDSPKIFVDCTLGGAGHSTEIAKHLGHDSLLIGIDQDETALAAANLRFRKTNKNSNPHIKLIHDNFGNLDNILTDQNIPGIDAILMDLGLSSHQIDTNSRGFSFKEKCPLDMRMDPTKQTLNAAKILDSYGTEDLIRVLRKFSDEKFAPQIAAAIVEARSKQKIETSDQLVNIVKSAIPAPARRSGGHPAKRTFQALRIEVNQELQMLTRGLDAAIRWLNPGGRIAVLNYHSLEDRIVKDAFKAMENRCTCPPDLPRCICNKKPILKLITKKPALPSDGEIEKNPRARSAKLRVAEKCK